MRRTANNLEEQVLIDHKVQSASLHKELDSLARDRDQVRHALRPVELSWQTPHSFVSLLGSTVEQEQLCGRAWGATF